MEFAERLSSMSVDDRYRAVVDYMEEIGFKFIPEQRDHVNNRYRIMENGSSFFVKNKYFRLHLCDDDKHRLDPYPEYVSEPNYKDVANKKVDPPRPYRYDITDPELFIKALHLIIGKPMVNDINVAVPPRSIDYSGEVIRYVCPNCGENFLKAPRCPECGQLIKEM